MKRVLTPHEEFVLDRSSFAAKMIAEFTRDFGVERARALIAELMARDGFSPLTTAILKTAWGGSEWSSVGE